MSADTHKKTVLITGAAGALGSALSMECAVKGFNTIMLDKNSRGLDLAWDTITARGLDEPVLHPLDLSIAGPESFSLLAEAIKGEFGGLDAVVHCAASFNGLSPSDQVSPDDWLDTLQVNLNSAWLLSMTCLPLLRASSESSLYFLLEDPDKMKGAYWGAYGASKQALTALTLQLHTESELSTVQVLGLNPGPLASPLRARAYLSEDPKTLPEPEFAAKKIVTLMCRSVVPESAIVNLDRLNTQ